MGGYGAGSTKVKGSHYTDTKGFKVSDKNAIEVAEYYIKQGKYVAFLHEGKHRRADLSVGGRHVEVKGLTTLSPSTIEKHLENAFQQVDGDRYRYPPKTWREGKVVLLSRHDSSVSRITILDAMRKGFESAQRKGEITGKVEVWIRGKIYKLN